MTEKLYDQDSFLRTFSAKVVSCAAQDGRFAVILDRTAFFPQGGGQYADRGTVGDADVLDVQMEGDEIVHYLSAPLEAGTMVCGNLDFALRFRRMQNHTGEHIVSGIVHRLFGLDNVGFHLGDGDMTVDYNGVLSRADLDRVETLANEAVAQDLPVRAEYPDPALLESIQYRSKLELTENVRIVTIGDVDCCACCAPHVTSSGQVGCIKILDFERYKGGVRCHMLCGAEALEDYRRMYTGMHAISLLLRVPRDEAAQAVERMQQTLHERAYEIAGLQRELALAAMQNEQPVGNALCFFAPAQCGMDALRYAVNRGMERAAVCAGFCAVQNGWQYCIGSAQADLRAQSRAINAGISGRGGGQRSMIQGTAAADAQSIRDFFAHYEPEIS